MPRRALKYFMWGYQPHFRASVQYALKQLLSAIGADVQCEVVLVGLLEQPRDDRYPCCIEPEECGIEVELFDSVWARVERLRSADPRSNIIHTLPEGQEAHDRQLRGRCIRDAVLSVLRDQDRTGFWEYFCAFPVSVEGFAVCTVVRASRDSLSRHYSLRRSSWQYGPYHSVSLECSLVHACISQILTGSTEGLSRPKPGCNVDAVSLRVDEMQRRAGERLMETPAVACGDLPAFRGLFRACDTVSSLSYEGAETTANLAMARHDHPNLEKVVAFANPVVLDDHRALRKTLEMTSPDLIAFATDRHVHSLGKTVGRYAPQHEDLFRVRFVGRHRWELEHDGHVMMRVSGGLPRLPGRALNAGKLQDTFERLFPEAPDHAASTFSRLADAVTGSGHGTTLIVHPDAQSEAQRLEAECTRVKPFLLDSNLAPSVTSIDGAVLVAPDCVCHAVGTILDGLASDRCQRARGARYNSAVRYVYTNRSKGTPCLAVVVSQDGTVDMIPDLRPQVSRQTVEDKMEALIRLSEQDAVDDEAYQKAMRSLNELRFYLTPDDCERLNSAKREAEKHLPEPEMGEIMLSHDPFVPDPEMDDSYYLP